VSEIDDRFVIMGAGDALTVRFDATECPPLPAGWRRDFLLFLDGWAKDRDPPGQVHPGGRLPPQPPVLLPPRSGQAQTGPRHRRPR
ncbi:MAG: hypothetical protein L0Z62_12455, partial [Gemmataceae bacterium]|nr:hypothetical protein [Gemmataceae bacterium]